MSSEERYLGTPVPVSLHAKLSTVRELRADSTERSQRKGDLTVSELSADGVPTIADVRWNHLPPDRHLP